MKSIAITIDLILVFIVFLIFLNIFYIYFSPPLKISEYIKEQRTAQDILISLDKVKTYEIRNAQEILDLCKQKLKQEEEIYFEELLNKSVLETFITLYASNCVEESKMIIKNFTIFDGFDIIISNATHSESLFNKSLKNFTVASRSFVSGFELGKPVRGYVARAWLSSYKKNTTLIYHVLPSGSGWKQIGIPNIGVVGGPLELKKIFEIPQGEILNGILYVSLHVGNIQTETALFQEISINGVNIRNKVLDNLVYSQCIGTTEINCAIYSIVNITDLLRNGKNELYIKIGAPQDYHSHTHPGFKISVEMKIPERFHFYNKTFLKRIYFDNVTGRSGVWTTLSFYIPENANFYNASLNLKLLNVEDTFYYTLNTSDILIFLNSENPIFKDGSDDFSQSYPFPYCKSYRYFYCVRDIKATKDIELKLNLTNYTKKGSNVLSIYVNSFGDYHFGKDYAQIFSDFQNFSYVEVYYTIDKPLLDYGEIEIAKEEFFGRKLAENPKNYTFFANKSYVETFVNVAQGFSALINATLKNIFSTTFFISPSLRATPNQIYLPVSLILEKMNNTIILTDFQPSGIISPYNYFLNYTTFEYHYKVKGIVGYGKVFENLEDAINDAINRLLAQVGNDVIGEIEIDSKSVYGLRWLFGPIEIKIVI